MQLNISQGLQVVDNTLCLSRLLNGAFKQDDIAARLQHVDHEDCVVYLTVHML